MKGMYIANMIVAGWIGVTSVSSPRYAAMYIFSNVYQQTEVIRLVGALWLSIAILSALGLARPFVFSPILLVQLIYKSTWLLTVALPAFRKQEPFPVAMTWFFIVWVVILPFVIPWRSWF